MVGSAQPKELIDQGAIAITPREDFLVLKEKYATGGLSKEDLYRYLNIVKASGDDNEAAKVFETYFLLSPAVSGDMFKMITSYVNSTSHKAFEYLIANRKDFASNTEKEKVDGYIKSMYMNEFRRRKYADDAQYQAAKKLLKEKMEIDEKEELRLDTDHYLAVADEKKYMEYCTKLFNKYYKNDDFEISNIVGGGFRLVQNKEFIATTRKWAQRALSLKDNSLNNATLAMVYAKEKNKKMALKYINASLEASKRDNDGYIPKIEMFKKEIIEGKY